MRASTRYLAIVATVIAILAGTVNKANAQDTGVGYTCPDTFTDYPTLNECRNVCVSNCKAVDNTTAPPPAQPAPVAPTSAEPAQATPVVKDAQPSSSGLGTLSPRPNQQVSNGINIGYLQKYSESVISIINYLFVPVLMAVAFLYFLIGVYKYFILGADDEGERTKGREFVLYSVIGFVVIFSIWGLVGVVSGTFNLQPGGTAPDYPLL